MALVWTTNKQILNLEFVKRLEKNITFVVTRISGNWLKETAPIIYVLHLLFDLSTK